MSKGIGFENFFGHRDPHVAKIATLLAEAKVHMQNGEIARDEFEELANDMIDTIDIDKHSSSLEMRIKVRAALEQLKEIIAGIPL